MGKRVALAIAKVICGIAGVVFLFCPFKTDTQILINVGALVVALICGAIIYNLDDSDDTRKSGYWPQEPAKSALYRDPHPRRVTDRSPQGRRHKIKIPTLTSQKARR